MRLIFMQLTILALTGLALFAYTGSGLSEQLFPTIAAGSIMACMVVDSPRERLMRRFFKNGISAQFVWALSLAAILCAYFLTYDTRFHLHFAQTGKTRYDDRAPFAEEIERLAKPGDRVMFLTDGIRPAYPLSLQLGLRPASKWLYAFPLRLAYSEDPYDIDFTRIGLSGDEPAADKLEYLDMEKRLQNFFQNEEEELDRNSPRLVVVQTGSPEIALRKHHIMAVLEEKYYVAATLDWSTFKEHTTRQKLDLLGDLSPMRVYVLK
jgi:hypothetical protein